MLDATWASDSEALVHIKSIRLLAALDEEGRESIEQVKAAMEDFDTVDTAAATALKCAVEVHGYWGAARRGLAPRAAESGPEPFRREQPKVSRNQPCPCGSGKKYKRCCGVN